MRQTAALSSKDSRMRPSLCTRVAATAILLASLLPSTASAIIEGAVDSNTMDSPWAGVGSITIGTGTYSGALIAPNYVLTAAHVVSGRAPGDITFNLNFGGDLTHRIAADAVFVQPGYTGGVGIQGTGTKDLALIRLAQPAPAGVPIYDLYTDHLPQSAIITMVGYGAGGTGLAGPTINPRPDVKRVGANVAECFAFTPGIESCGIAALTGTGPRAVYFFDFDAPAAPGQPDGGRLPNEVSFAGGDSGSPAFVNVHGQWRVAGVNTFSGRLGESGPIGVYGSVGGGVLLSDDNGAWVRGVMSQPAAGSGVQPPVPEPRTWFLLCLGLPLLAWATMRNRVSAHRR
jgi:hypothetical protein